MKASLDQLSIFNKDKIFVMGDMGELGDKSYSHHLSILNMQKELGIKYLFIWANLKMRPK